VTPTADLQARCSFPPAGTAVTCAVSGGADSLALLVLAVDHGCDTTAVHVDHGLRPGSDREAEVVAAVAEGWGAAFRSVTVAVAPGSDLEARARRARYAALPPDVLTGHTADDQAETVLLNLLRGASLDGLAGYAPARRPLRALRRHDTHKLCADLGIQPVHDPSNDDPRFRRNRVRHELLPLLDALAEAIDPTDARALAAAPAPLAARAVRRWLRTGPEQHPPDAATVARVLAVARGEASACEVGGGRAVRRHAQRLYVADRAG